MKKFSYTMRKFENDSENYKGRCIECGATRQNCEGDARNYDCPRCRKNSVFGLEELLMMGNIYIK